MRLVSLFKLAPTVIGATVGAMIQVAGPAEAEKNICKWVAALTPDTSDTCLHGIPGSIMYLFSGALIVVGLVWFFWPKLTDFFNNWQLSWPIAKRESQPPKATLATRVFHVRSHAYFDRLESENQFRIVLFFLNATTEEIAIESVAGHLSYDSMEFSPIGWLDAHKPPKTPPFDEIEVNIQQHLSSTTVQDVWEQIKLGNSLSLEFHLQIKAKALKTGEVFELRPWDGITCAKPEYPVITGRFLMIRPETFTGSGGQKVK
jgi:hypothetical protein